MPLHGDPGVGSSRPARRRGPWVHLDPAFDAFGPLIVENLSAIWPNLRAAGARYFVLVRAILDGTLLGPLRSALPEASVTVVRLTASPETIAERLSRRDTGAVLAEHLREHASMTEAMDEAGIEDFVVVNDRRSTREVALEVLRRAGWVDPD